MAISLIWRPIVPLHTLVQISFQECESITIASPESFPLAPTSELAVYRVFVCCTDLLHIIFSNACSLALSSLLSLDEPNSASAH